MTSDLCLIDGADLSPLPGLGTHTAQRTHG